MFKKALIATAVLAASTGVAFANGGTYKEAPHATHNCYVSVGVTRDFVNYEISDHGYDHGYAYGYGYGHGDHVDLGDDGWDADLAVGIGWTFQDHYYLGLEAFGSITNNEAHFGPAEIEMEHSFGVSVLPGVKISDSTMAFLRLGWVRSRFEVKGGMFGGSISKSRNGGQVGIGLETMVTNNVSTSLEYDWARYGNWNVGGGATIKPTVNLVKLDVTYHFMEA